MNRLYTLAKGYNKRFPDGNDPYRIMTRLLEECGEVASEVHHFEGAGIKRQKHGEPDKMKLANEIRQSMTILAQAVVYYSIEEEFDQALADALERLRREGPIDKDSQIG